MKKIVLLLFVAILTQAGWMENLTQMAQSFQKPQERNKEEKSAIKEALNIGVKQAVQMLGKKGGFLHNPLVKIPIPKNLQLVATTLRKAGMGKYVKRFERSLNEAAEEAVPETASILTDTIKNMSIEEAKNLIFSQKADAITNYFKTHAGKKLAKKIAPIIKKHMENEQVTKYYQLMMEYYNKYATPYTNNSYAQAALQAFGMNTPQRIEEKDLASYVTNHTLEGLYTIIAQKEKAIRTNPAARVTPLLQKIFGKKTQ